MEDKGVDKDDYYGDCEQSWMSQPDFNNVMREVHLPDPSPMDVSTFLVQYK
jgi:hypothetical protein